MISHACRVYFPALDEFGSEGGLQTVMAPPLPHQAGMLQRHLRGLKHRIISATGRNVGTALSQTQRRSA
jgi:hypothetical protein